MIQMFPDRSQRIQDPANHSAQARDVQWVSVCRTGSGMGAGSTYLNP